MVDLEAGVATLAAPIGENRLADHLDQPSLHLLNIIIFTIIIINQNFRPKIFIINFKKIKTFQNYSALMCIINQTFYP